MRRSYQKKGETKWGGGGDPWKKRLKLSNNTKGDNKLSQLGFAKAITGMFEKEVQQKRNEMGQAKPWLGEKRGGEERDKVLR